MKKQFSWLAVLALSLLAAPVFAQVPQDVTFTGRLVDDLGDPLGGPVNLELGIFDAETMGTQLYSEQHLVVPLDATGGFSVQLGLGTSPSGTFDADLFSDVNRWLEVVVFAEVLAPRQIIGSVPWALVAERTTEVMPDPECPADSVMVASVCVDKYEGSVWQIPAANVELLDAVKSGEATLADLQAGGATQFGGQGGSPYPASFPRTGNWTEPLYAVSVAGVFPSASLTWFQAEQACRLADKRLVSNQEWQATAAGTPDPGTDNGTTDCNVGNVGVATTGARSGCVSTWGAFDMVGNLWEWVGDWVDPATTLGNWPADFGGDIVSWGGDGRHIVPAALARGGHWSNGTWAGVFAIDSDADALITKQHSTTGFRCARDL